MGDLRYAGAQLTVDLDALAYNYRSLKAQAPGAECAGVVKCDGYGLGAGPVARTLWAEGCRTFFVAQLQEAFALRKELPAEARICVLNGLGGMPPEPYLEADAVPVLNHLADIRHWQAFARRQERSLPAIVHIDTGMNRLGMGPDELERFIQEQESCLAGIDVLAFMSHLACGPQPDHPMNASQQRSFMSILKRLPRKPWSLANSAGVFMGESYHGDLARPGIALYGVNPCPEGRQRLKPNPMQPVVHVAGLVLQVRPVDSPMTVGYDAAYEVPRPAHIATVAVGYGDGYLRSTFANGPAFVAVNGRKARVVGKVSMDLITVDVTDQPGKPVEPGDTVEVLGDTVTVDALAGSAGTNGYEVLTALGHRYGRQYRGGPPGVTESPDG